MKSEAKMFQMPFNSKPIICSNKADELDSSLSKTANLIKFATDKLFCLEKVKNGLVRNIFQYTAHKIITTPVLKLWRTYYCIKI